MTHETQILCLTHRILDFCNHEKIQEVSTSVRHQRTENFKAEKNIFSASDLYN